LPGKPGIVDSATDAVCAKTACGHAGTSCRRGLNASQLTVISIAASTAVGLMAEWTAVKLGGRQVVVWPAWAERFHPELRGEGPEASLGAAEQAGR